MKQRKPLVAGNWKMNGDTVFNDHLLGELRAGIERESMAALGIVVCPPYPYLAQVANRLAGSPIEWGAQNVCERPNGAFTGEVSASMLVDLGCRWVIVGHSERRQSMHETDDDVCAKLAIAAAHGLGVIACIGETLDERESGRTESVLGRQVDALARAAHDAQRGGDCAAPMPAERFVLAYEPVWAIGTGRSASAEIAQQAHAFIRSRLGALDGGGQATRILYGGSVKPGNARSLFAMPDVDGGLIGGAALIAEDFLAICGAAAACSSASTAR
ncbi:MAG: triose-phosphate isomerase [Burkholderiaceae bacterium]|nr:triose-phosphate isomerase [Burkholderiaceae bacterium]